MRRYKWVLPFFWKRAKQHISYRLALLGGVDSYDVTIGNTNIKQTFFNAYHHDNAKAYALGPTDEDTLLRMWLEIPAKRVYDIGGYTGVYGLLYAKAHPQSEVVIFEPNPINARHVEANIALNGLRNCTLQPIAVTDYEGTLTFTDGTTGGEHIADTGVQVPCTTLAALPQADLIKIDVEGAEARVLSTLGYRTTILLEVHPAFLHRYGDSEDSLYALLGEGNYEKRLFDQRGAQKHFIVQ